MQLDAIDEVEEQDDSIEEKVLEPGKEFSHKPAIYKHKEGLDIVQAEKDLEIANEEWDQVEINTPTPIDTRIISQTQPITYADALDYFRSKNMKQYLSRIQPVKIRKGFDALKYWFTGPPSLTNTLIPDRNLFFAIALCPFDTSDETHIRVLQTLYKTLTNTEKDCPRYGKHWEELGFQGIDPGTDFRGCGFLGLLHLLSLAMNPETEKLAKEISLLSKNEKQNFPFCTMGINLTKIVLDVMREEILNRECNRDVNIFEVTNRFYAAIFFRLFVIWKEEQKTVLDSGYVIKSLSMYAKKHSAVILKELSCYTSSR